MTQKIIQRELEDDYGFFPSIISHPFSLLTLSSSSSKEIPHSVWARDLCLLFPIFKVAYSVFFNWITSPHLSRLRWNAPFSKEDLFNTPYFLFSQVPPSVLPEKTEVMHQFLSNSRVLYTFIYSSQSCLPWEKVCAFWYLILDAHSLGSKSMSELMGWTKTIVHFLCEFLDCQELELPYSCNVPLIFQLTMFYVP